MDKELLANKDRLLRFSFFELVIERLSSCKKRDSGIIGFKDVFIKLGRSLQIKKSQIWNILYILQDLREIKIIPHHGVIVNQKKGE